MSVHFDFWRKRMIPREIRNHAKQQGDKSDDVIGYFWEQFVVAEKNSAEFLQKPNCNPPRNREGAISIEEQVTAVTSLRRFPSFYSMHFDNELLMSSAR